MSIDSLIPLPIRLILGLGVLAIASLPSAAHACSCMPPAPPADALEAAAAVFEGRVTKITKLGEPELGPRDLEVTVQVVRAFKGANQEQLTLITPGDTAACGYPFRAKESYLVYAHGGAKQLRVSLCSRTRPIDEAEEDLAVLGMGYVPADPAKPDDPRELTAPTDRSPPAGPTNRRGCASCSLGHCHLTSDGGDRSCAQDGILGSLGVVALLGLGLWRRRRSGKRSAALPD